MKLQYKNIANKYQTIRQVLKQEFKLPNRLISRLKQDKAILLNGLPMYIDKEIYVDDEVLVYFKDIEEISHNVVATPMPLSILYEDESILVINKPPFMPVHPSSSHYDDSLANGVQHYFFTFGIQKKIRLVNRLDKDTSGIVIFAKNAYVQEMLIRQMKEKIFHKKYIALLEGKLEKTKGTIDAPIARKEGSIIERCINPNGDTAITHFELKKQYSNYAVVEFLLETGRTHQIRVHSKYIGHPIMRRYIVWKRIFIN